MSDPSLVTLLYTANIRGDLALLPRLATVIRRERQASEGLVLLLDLGDTCSADVWVCRATLGRAPLLVLDAMGYDAALIGGPEHAPIPPEALRRFRENAGMLTPIWGRPAQISRRGIVFPLVSGGWQEPTAKGTIFVDRSRPAVPDVGQPDVCLGDVSQGKLARIDVAWPEWTVQRLQVIHVGPDVPPDSSAAAVVDLVESEAHYLASQEGDL